MTEINNNIRENSGKVSVDASHNEAGGDMHRVGGDGNTGNGYVRAYGCWIASLALITLICGAIIGGCVLWKLLS